MAPNNGLANAKEIKQKTTIVTNNETRTKKDGKSGRTTVLKAGTVEDRGMGTHTNSRQVISNQIQEFLHGEGRFTLKAEIREFFTVWTFVTRLPGPTWVDHHPGYLMRGMAYFPFSGSLIGIFVSVFFDLAHFTLGLPLTIASVISEVASLWVTGCFHEDGLADSSDGIGGGWSRDQILKIMTDTRLGTYGCAVLLLYMIAKLELLTTLGASTWDLYHCEGAGPAIIVTHTLARLTAPLLIRTRDYVDEQGPKYKFYSFFVEAKHLVTWYRAFFAIFTSFLLAFLAYGVEKASILIFCVVLSVFFSGRYAEYLLGGVMGDYLGATICVTEVFLLTIMLLIPHIQDHALFIAELFSIVSSVMNGISTLEELFGDVRNDERKVSLLKFVVVSLFTTVWCSFVGHPPVFVRKSVQAKGETKEIQISLDSETNKKSDQNNEKEEMDPLLERQLSDANLNFTQRYNSARKYLDSLAKPIGSLGTLEDWGARLAALQKSSKPYVNAPVCLIFAADHGVAKDKAEGGENCSAYPQAVTRKIIEALEHEIAGASVLAAQNDVALRVIDVGVAGDTFTLFTGFKEVVTVSEHKIKGGTGNFCTSMAMSQQEVDNCILAGRKEVGYCIDKLGANVIAFGEVGIGNTTTSSALIASITGEPVDDLCGGGAAAFNVNEETIISDKIRLVKKAISFHEASTMLNNPTNALKNIGGAEIAAIVGGILEASKRNVAVLIDGFIVTTAAMIACQMSPKACQVLLFATQSTEKGQSVAIKAIKKIAEKNSLPIPAMPVLDMNLRMGEGTGALMTVPVLRSAAAVISHLATLETVLNIKNKVDVC